MDDSTCDEGATSETEMQFLVQNYYGPLTDVDWCFTDVDAATGTLVGAETSGNTGETSEVNVTLDCANGWMLMDTVADQNVSYHLYFRVLPSVGWPIVLMPEQLAPHIIGASIADPSGGALEVYRIGMTGNPDLQAVDSLSIDGSPNLIPGDALDDLGLSIYDGNPGGEDYDIWGVDHPIPGNDGVIEVLYTDASEGRSFLLNVGVPSWEDAGGAHHITAIAISG